MIKCDKCGEIDHVLVDGYAVGDRMLEGVMFEVRQGKKKGAYKAKVVQESAEYFSSLNEKKWLKEIEGYAAELDIAGCPKCDGDVDMPNVLPERKPVKVAVSSFADILNIMKGPGVGPNDCECNGLLHRYGSGCPGYKQGDAQ